MKTSASFQDWIAPNGLTQLLGATGTGKTTIMGALGREWKGEGWYLSPETMRDAAPDPHKGSSLELLLQTVLSLSLEENSLLLLDDLMGFYVDPQEILHRSKLLHKLFTVLGRASCTTVVSFQTKDPESTYPNMGIPKSAAFYSSAILDLVELVQTEDGGVVVEVFARKSKRYPTGTQGRLWVRPAHDTPVCAT